MEVTNLHDYFIQPIFYYFDDILFVPIMTQFSCIDI
jgi:hypothetical protein